MKLSNQSILLFSRSTQHGGTENVIVQLCEILQPEVKKIVVCTADGFRAEMLDKMGIRYYRIPDIENKSLKVMIKVSKCIKNIVKQEHITIIHSHHRMAAFYAELLFGKSIVKVANAHNTFTNKKFLTRFSYRNTHIVAVGEKVKENLINIYGVSEKQITVIHNSVKPFNEDIIPIKELQAAKANNYTLVGNVGRLSRQKGMPYFIKAAVIVLKQCPKAKFYIVGDGEDMERLKKLADELLTENSFAKDHIVFLGYRADIQNIISQMDFLVLSSLWEGFPLTPIEAFSVQKPVIATAVDGTSEIVKNQENGLLVKTKDEKGLADAMIRLINNNNERKEFGINAYRSFKKEFSFCGMKERYLAYYKNL